MQKEGTPAGCIVGITGIGLFIFGVVFGTFANQIGAAAIYLTAICFFGGIALAIIGLIMSATTKRSSASSSISQSRSVIPSRPNYTVITESRDPLEQRSEEQPGEKILKGAFFVGKIFLNMHKTAAKETFKDYFKEK